MGDEAPPGNRSAASTRHWHRWGLPPDRREVIAEAIRVRRADGYRVRARLFPANDLRDAVLGLEWTRKKRRI